MTKAEALEELRRLAGGLAPDLAGSSRLLERIASHEDAEALRDALVEVGAMTVLDDPKALRSPDSGTANQMGRSPIPGSGNGRAAEAQE